jgi:2,3-bisphosphoglycerate-independent phosphoglycerate mutase
LLTSGENVGLPTAKGQLGSRTPEHCAGRVIYQDMVKITKAIRDKSLWKEPQIVKAFTYAKENKKTST